MNLFSKDLKRDEVIGDRLVGYVVVYGLGFITAMLVFGL